MENSILFPDAPVLVTDLFDIHQDWEVPIPAFFIIASERKIRSIEEFTDEEALEFIHLIRILRKGMREALGIKDVYFFQNEDTEHGFHFWVFPRHDWMLEFGQKIQSVRPIMNYAKENMKNEKVFREVEESAEKMKDFMKIFGVKNS